MPGPNHQRSGAVTDRLARAAGESTRGSGGRLAGLG